MQQQNFSFIPMFDIDDLVQESILRLLKAKTGIRSAIQLRRTDYFTTFKKQDGAVKITAVFMKPKISPKFIRISASEINLSGATNEEFFDYVNAAGANPVCSKKGVLALI